MEHLNNLDTYYTVIHYTVNEFISVAIINITGEHRYWEVAPSIVEY